MSGELLRRAEAVHSAALLGDYRDLVATRMALRQAATPSLRAWALPLEALLAAVDSEWPRLDADAFEPFISVAPAPCAIAAGHLARLAMLGLDRGLLDAAATLAKRVHSAGVDARSEARLFGVDLWWAAAEGRARESDIETLRAMAVAAELPGLAVEATIHRALLSARSDLPRATEAARRASRMARVEGLLHDEYLAHTVLARIRRLSGTSYLGERIATALLLVVPTPARAWVEWEAVQSGAIRSAAGRYGEAASALFSAAERGEDGTAEARAMREHVRGFVDLERDVDELVAALDARRDVALPWAVGDGPDYFATLQSAARPDDERSPAYVLVDPRRARGRRVLRSGLGLLAEMPDAIEHGRRHDARIQTLLAALGIAGQGGLEEPVAFGLVYGFPYAPGRHEGVWAVLLHRTRKLLEGRGRLERDGGRLRLVAERTLVIADPRCTDTLEQRVLGCLAAPGVVSSKSIAHTLGVSDRAVRAVLSRLVDDGACVPERNGRHVAYRLEDTTFSEPTYTRLRGQHA